MSVPSRPLGGRSTFGRLRKSYFQTAWSSWSSRGVMILLAIGCLVAFLVTMAPQNTTDLSLPPQHRVLVVLWWHEDHHHQGDNNYHNDDRAWASLERHVLRVNQAAGFHVDLAILIDEPILQQHLNKGQPQSQRSTQSLLDRATYVWPLPVYTDWWQAVDLINGTHWRDTIWPWIPLESPLRDSATARAMMMPWFLAQHLLVLEDPQEEEDNHQRGHDRPVQRRHGPWKGRKPVRRRPGLLRRFRERRRKRREEDPALLHHYDRFVIMPSHSYYVCDLELQKLDSSYVWIPHSAWNLDQPLQASVNNNNPRMMETVRIRNREVVVSQEHVEQVLNVGPPVWAHPQRYSELLRHPETTWERLVAHRWLQDEQLPLQTLERVMFGTTTHHNKIMDNTTTLSPVYVEPEDLWVTPPYQDYAEAYTTCGYQPGLLRLPTTTRGF